MKEAPLKHSATGSRRTPRAAGSLWHASCATSLFLCCCCCNRQDNSGELKSATSNLQNVSWNASEPNNLLGIFGIARSKHVSSTDTHALIDVHVSNCNIAYDTRIVKIEYSNDEVNSVSLQSDFLSRSDAANLAEDCLRAFSTCGMVDTSESKVLDYFRTNGAMGYTGVKAIRQKPRFDLSIRHSSSTPESYLVCITFYYSL